MIRLTRNMPKKITDANLYSSTATYFDDSHKLPAPAFCEADYFLMMKRMGELEGKVIALASKPAVVPPEKEEQLNVALSRVDALEQALSSTQKVPIPACLVVRDELIKNELN